MAQGALLNNFHQRERVYVECAGREEEKPLETGARRKVVIELILQPGCTPGTKSNSSAGATDVSGGPRRQQSERAHKLS